MNMRSLALAHLTRRTCSLSVKIDSWRRSWWNISNLQDQVLSRRCRPYRCTRFMEWRVLFLQRRRWINGSQFPRLLPELFGFCCFSMRFFVFIDLLGALVSTPFGLVPGGTILICRLPYRSYLLRLFIWVLLLCRDIEPPCRRKLRPVSCFSCWINYIYTVTNIFRFIHRETQPRYIVDDLLLRFPRSSRQKSQWPFLHCPVYDSYTGCRKHSNRMATAWLAWNQCTCSLRTRYWTRFYLPPTGSRLRHLQQAKERIA